MIEDSPYQSFRLSAPCEKVFRPAVYLNNGYPKPKIPENTAKQIRFSEARQSLAAVFTSLMAALQTTDLPRSPLDLQQLSATLTQKLNTQSKTSPSSLNNITVGLENAIKSYIGFAELAASKIEQLTEARKRDFKELFTEVLKNNRHIAEQFSQIHMAVLLIFYDLNGVKLNQLKPYKFDKDNFDLYNKDGSIYLLPTLRHLDAIINKTKDPSTTVSRPYINKKGNLAHTATLFSDMHLGPILTCPAFQVSDPATDQTLADTLFDQLDKLILGVICPDVK